MKAIGILGHVGNGNLGDEALFTAAAQNARALYPSARLVGFSVNPADSIARHGIDCFPLRHAHDHPTLATQDATTVRPTAGLAARLRYTVKQLPGVPQVIRGTRRIAWMWREARFLAASFGVVRRLDALVIAGSGQLNEEWGGAWGFPYTLFKWTLLARLGGARVAYLSVGATDLHQPLSGWFVGRALRLATYRSYRDAGTKKIVSRFLPADGAPVVPDLAFSLHIPVVPAVATTRSVTRVAINPMALYDGSPWPHTDAATSDRYADSLARFCSWLIAQGYEVELFTSQHRIDGPMARRIAACVLADTGVTIPVIAPPTPHEALGTIGDADFVIGTRFHGILFSLLLCKPVVALSYERKARQLMASVGQADSVIDVHECSTEGIQSAFLRLVAEREERVRQLAEAVPAFRDRLTVQYLEALGPVPSTLGPGEAASTAGGDPSRVTGGLKRQGEAVT